MIKLTKATVHKYKSIENTQSFAVNPEITVLVGMNESGKTSILEVLAKSRYFEKDGIFKFDKSRDYPRKQLKTLNKSDDEPMAVTLTYIVGDELANAIFTDVGVKISSREFSVSTRYDGHETWSVNGVTVTAFLAAKFKSIPSIDKTILDSLSKINNAASFDIFVQEITDEAISESIKPLKGYFENKNNWSGSPISEYIMRCYLSPKRPKFMYYDDYYLLPSRVSLNDIEKSTPTEPSEKTAKALLDLADIDVGKVLQDNNFEDFIAEIEATQAIISDELFKYWSTNKNLEILFQIDKKEKKESNGTVRIIDHILDIRVKNKRSGVSLPLGNRSKGFNWFFSFLVWFKRIQENKDSTYILLLDEPGLNLHAKAQNDLLTFLSDLTKEHGYQIIYTTHSPFMIETDKLNHVRTVVEKEDGTHISESVQEKDPNTLFPLQAALGYDLAQNLFVSPKNLIVEGIADLVYLNLISGVLQANGKAGLKNGITIVPVGGADKVATFVSLLRGNELDMACLLDTFTDQSARDRLNNLIAQKIIQDKKIVFYDEFTDNTHADIEDLFLLDDYLPLYNGALSKKYTLADFDSTKPILTQLKKKNSGKDFNHYLPANYLAKNIATIALSDATLEKFDSLFTKINKLL